MRRLIRRLARIETVAVLVVAWLAGALALGLATSAGAVPTVALIALGPLLGGLLLLIRHRPGMTSAIWPRYATLRWRASALMARATRGTPGRRGRT